MKKTEKKEQERTTTKVFRYEMAEDSDAYLEFYRNPEGYFEISVSSTIVVSGAEMIEIGQQMMNAT